MPAVGSGGGNRGLTVNEGRLMTCVNVNDVIIDGGEQQGGREACCTRSSTGWAEMEERACLPWCLVVTTTFMVSQE